MADDERPHLIKEFIHIAASWRVRHGGYQCLSLLKWGLLARIFHREAEKQHRAVE